MEMRENEVDNRCGNKDSGEEIRKALVGKEQTGKYRGYYVQLIMRGHSRDYVLLQFLPNKRWVPTC